MKSLGALKSPAKRVMGVDASTNSIAFCILNGGELESYGEIMFSGANIYDRVLDARKKMRALGEEFRVDYVAIEAAVVVRSVAVGIKMAYVFGVIIAELMAQGAKVREVPPISWQSYIGNPALTKSEKDNIKKMYPGKSRSWYTNKNRQFRKQRTMDFFNSKYGLSITSDNVTDAFGLAYWAVNHTS